MSRIPPTPKPREQAPIIIACRYCHAQTFNQPPHRSDPCPYALELHQADMAVRAARVVALKREVEA